MKKTIILLVSSLLLLCSCGKEKKFDALFADAVDTALETAVLSEKVCNETKSAWSTAIYDHRDPNGDICSDFNDALDVLHENIEKKGTYDEIEEKKSALNSMAKGLSGCPGSRKEVYNELIAFITDINAFANLATDPSGSLQSYTSEVRELDNSISKQFNSFKIKYANILENGIKE